MCKQYTLDCVVVIRDVEAVDSFQIRGWDSSKYVQYDWSKDDLDWRKDFKYLNFICFMKNLRSRLIKGCSIA